MVLFLTILNAVVTAQPTMFHYYCQAILTIFTRSMGAILKERLAFSQLSFIVCSFQYLCCDFQYVLLHIPPNEGLSTKHAGVTDLKYNRAHFPDPHPNGPLNYVFCL